MKKFAVFDIDGTIFRWQLFHEMFDEFVESGIIDSVTAEPVLTSRNKWRQGESTWIDYELKLIETLDKAIIGVNLTTMEQFADKIIARRGKVLYKYTLNLLKELQNAGYFTIALSGSHQQLVDKFAKLYGIDVAIGLDYSQIDGKLTEKKQIVYGQKDKLLKKVVQENNLDWTDSYAVGDTKGDANMLELVENPIAFNPDEELLSIAKSNGWKIVVERKGVAYSMERNSDGLYILE